MEFHKYYKEADCQMKYMMFGLPKEKMFFLCFRPFVSFVEGQLLQHCNLLGRPQGVYNLPMKILWVLMCLHEPVVFVIFVVQACCKLF